MFVKQQENDEEYMNRALKFFCSIWSQVTNLDNNVSNVIWSEFREKYQIMRQYKKRDGKLSTQTYTEMENIPFFLSFFLYMKIVLCLYHVFVYGCLCQFFYNGCVCVCVWIRSWNNFFCVCLCVCRLVLCFFCSFLYFVCVCLYHKFNCMLNISICTNTEAIQREIYIV